MVRFCEDSQDIGHLIAHPISPILSLILTLTGHLDLKRKIQMQRWRGRERIRLWQGLDELVDGLHAGRRVKPCRL